MKIGQHIYSQSTDDNNAGDFSSKKEDMKDENVVDADFEEVKEDKK